MGWFGSSGKHEQRLEEMQSRLAGKDGAARNEMLREMARVASEELDDADRAVEYLDQALSALPGDRDTQHERLERLVEAKRWRDSVDQLGEIADAEDNPVLAAKYLYSAGVICRDELRDKDAAIEFFSRSLDADPNLLKAFEIIDRILTKRQNWAAQQEAWTRMIERLARVPDSLELQVQLWKGLAAIRDRRLGDPAGGQAALAESERLEKLLAEST